MNLKQLSDILGLSQTTVSRALNGYPEVNTETRQRVEHAAREHNYRPNTRARGLAIGRSMAIGHIIPQATSHEAVNPVFGDFIGGAGEIYAKNNYDMLISFVGDRDEVETYKNMAAKGSVDGIIIHGPKVEEPRIPLIRDLGLPFVVHGRAGPSAPDYTWVDVNNKRAFERATDLLIQLGHTRIAFLNGDEQLGFAARRRQGYETSLAKAGIAPLPHLMFSKEMSEFYGYRTTQDLLDHAQPPTAFLTSSIVIAAGVRRAVLDRGLHMGTDISIITHDDDLSYMPNGDHVPVFTATQSSVRQAGRDAARMLLNKIEAPDTPLDNHMLEAQLVIGQSTGPAPD
ncbi:MAG: substrate-binding domain-containing protein [Pseudomonadota bacterium]